MLAEQDHDEDDVLNFLNRFAYNVIFDENGMPVDVVDIRGDRDIASRVAAIEAFYERLRPEQDVLLPTGFTLHQTRVLRARAPIDAHIMLADDRAGKNGVRRVTAYLPSRVQMRLFHLLFGDQFSFEIADHRLDERHAPHKGPSDNGGGAPGGVDTHHQAIAKVRLTLHLGNGQTRAFEGVGMAQDKAENSDVNPLADFYAARRSGKGVVSDAWRGAIERIAPVFKTAFGEGSEMMENVRSLILKRISATGAVIRTRPANRNGQDAAASENADRRDATPLARHSAPPPARKPTPAGADAAAAHENPPMQDAADPARAGQDEPGQDEPGQDDAGQDEAGQDEAGQDEADRNGAEAALAAASRRRAPKGAVTGGRAVRIGAGPARDGAPTRDQKQDEGRAASARNTKPAGEKAASGRASKKRAPKNGGASRKDAGPQARDAQAPVVKTAKTDGGDEDGLPSFDMPQAAQEPLDATREVLLDFGLESMEDLDGIDAEIADDIRAAIAERMASLAGSAPTGPDAASADAAPKHGASRKADADGDEGGDEGAGREAVDRRDRDASPEPGDLVVDPKTTSWESALQAYRKLFEAHGVEAVLDANKELTRRLFKGRALRVLAETCESLRRR